MANKVVVTGGAGFIGSNLVEELTARGYEVHVIDNLSGGKRMSVSREATLHEADILDTDHMGKLFEGARVLFHLAALPRVPYSIEHPAESNRVNVDGTVSVLTAARDAGVEKVIYSASGSAYGDSTTLPYQEDMRPAPVNPYGLQKHIGELYVELFAKLFKIRGVSLRYFNVYGPRMDPSGPYGLAIARFLEQKKNGKPLTIVGDGTQTRDFVHVSDVVRANILAAEHPALGNGEVINIGTGRSTSVNTLANLIDPDGPRTPLPPRAEGHDSVADITRARELLGWEPTIFLEEGIAKLKEEGSLISV